MKNVKLAYFITFFRYTWFWLGTWAIYYFSFGGNYAIGLLETVMILTSILAEIPTGAVGDLLGKKKTLILSFFLSAVSNFAMGFSPNLFFMSISLIFMNIGGAFASGSFEAMIYDSLKSEKKEELYHRVISNVSTITMIAFGVFGILGGYISRTDLRIPYFLNGTGLIISMLLSFFITEPEIDSEKLSVSKYLRQQVDGVRHLFRGRKIIEITLKSLFIGSIMLIFAEGLDDILLLDFGFRDKPFEMSLVVSCIFFSGALATYVVPRITKKIHKDVVYILELIIYTLTMLASPFLHLYFGALSVLFRSSTKQLIGNNISVSLNENLESKYRSTSLSAFSMLQGIPYALSIFGISALTDIISSRYIAFVFGIFVLGFIVYNVLLKLKYR